MGRTVLVLLTILAAATAAPPGRPELAELPQVGVRGVAFLEPSCESRLQRCQEKSRALAARVAHLEAKLEAIRDVDAPEAVGSPSFNAHAVCAFFCVVMAALAAGLTMGLVSIEPMEMKIIVNTEDKDMTNERDKLKLKEDQAAARRVLPLIQDHHRLLVTLLLMNSLANEALPLFLDHIVPSWLAVVLSVTLVLMFGEIIPSAIFTGSDQLKIAARFAPIVTFFKISLTPIAWPIAKVLDRLLGEDHKGRYNFAELRAIVGIHANLRADGQHIAIFKCHDDKQLGIITTAEPHHFTDETVVVFDDAPKHPAKSTKLRGPPTFYYVSPCEPMVGRDPSCTFRLYTSEERGPNDLITFSTGELTSGAFVVQERDELKMMHGVMKLTHMCAVDGLRTLSQVVMLEQSETMSRELMRDILSTGHSRLPVYRDDKHNVRGFIHVKRLIGISPEEGRRVGDIDMQPLVLVPPHIPMLELLNKFQEDRCHIALVTSAPDVVRTSWETNTTVPPDVHMMGIITMEDVIEILIQEDIWDEHDVRDGHVADVDLMVRKVSTGKGPRSQPHTLQVPPHNPGFSRATTMHLRRQNTRVRTADQLAEFKEPLLNATP